MFKQQFNTRHFLASGKPAPGLAEKDRAVCCGDRTGRDAIAGGNQQARKGSGEVRLHTGQKAVYSSGSPSRCGR
jgi:hypothetical protein